MSPSPAIQKAEAGQPDLGALKLRQHAAWSSGDYAVVGTTLQIVGEDLCEALDLRSGQKVLDVAAGNGNVTLAAARRWRGFVGRIQGGRRGGAGLCRRQLRHCRVDLRRHVRSRS